MNKTQFTLEDLYLAAKSHSVKKIKITSKFADYLKQTCNPTFQNKEQLPPGVIGKFIGIPIEIDDTIKNEYYELILKE